MSGLGFGTGQNDGHGLTSEPMVSENNRPGASWMNKRAEEEAHRALEFVVDKDFSLRMFYAFFLLPSLSCGALAGGYANTDIGFRGVWGSV